MVFGLQKLQDELFCMTEERNYFQGKYTEQVSEIAALKEELRIARREILRLRGELMETSQANLLDTSNTNTKTATAAPNGVDQDSSNNNNHQTPTTKGRRRRQRKGGRKLFQEEKKEQDGNRSHDEDDDDDGEEEEYGSSDEEEGDDHGHASLTDDDDDKQHNNHEDEDEEEQDTEAAAIRQSAEKLLQWASYRSYTRSSASACNSPTDQSSIASGTAAATALATATTTTAGSALGPMMVPRTIESKSSIINHGENGPSAAGLISPSLSHDSGATLPTNNSNHENASQDEDDAITSTTSEAARIPAS